MPALSLDLAQTKQFTSILKKEGAISGFEPSTHQAIHSNHQTPAAKASPVRRQSRNGRTKAAAFTPLSMTVVTPTLKSLQCRAVFCEWDDRPKEWQIDAWQDLGLPEPTLQVDTGGKSIHNYWVFAEPIPVDDWKSLQTRLLDHADADRSLKNPSRVMRLPGTFHIDADGQPGGRTCIIHTSDIYYSARDIEKALPSKKMHDKMVEANRYTDYKPRSLDEIREALDKVPARKAGTGTYHIYRNLFWGLIKAVEEAGSTRDQAISLMQSNSPSWKGLQQIATFWW